MAENGLQDDFVECPLCMEPLALDDINFYPCACRYQICRFCWHRIRTDENGLCPHCREPYSENPAEYTPPTQEQMAKLKSDKKQRHVEKRQKIIDSRKSLASVRVVQKNLVFVIGLSPRLADPEVLKKNEYFGKFGRIYKVVINNHTVYNGAQGPSVSAYVTYVRNEDASKAITAVNNAYIDGRYLKASFGTTKYCTSFLRGMQCSKPDCMYLHELGDNDASFTKEDMQLGKHQVYETATLAASNVPASFKDMQQQPQSSVVMGTGSGVKIKHVAHNKPVVTSTTDSAESALPATASWGSSVKPSSQAANHSGSEAPGQQSLAKDTKTNSNPALSHSHSAGTATRHKHQQLHKSHSHSPSHSTGVGHTTSSSHSRSSSKLASKELTASHHSQTKSGPLSPTHNNEPSTSSKKHSSSREHGHNRSNSTSKSTPSLSPKSTLSGSSSSGSLKHDVESEVVVSEGKGGSGDIAVQEGEQSLDTSREEEEEEGSDGGKREDDTIGSNERGKREIAVGGGGWCQIEDATENSDTTVSQPVVRGEEGETNEVAGATKVVAEGEKEREGKENLTTVDKIPLKEEPKATPTSSSQQQQEQDQTEDSSIVKVIPSFGSGLGQFGSLGVSWNAALPQQPSTSIDSAPTQPTATIDEGVATPTDSTHHEDDLGFDPWDVSQQGLADLMKSEQHQSHQHNSGGMPLSNGIGNGNKPNSLQEEFKALFPSANVSFDGPSLGGSSESLLSSGSSKPVGAVPATNPTTSYVPSRLDSALSSTYRSLLGTSSIPPITSSSSTSTHGGSLNMFLGQHQPGFPSSSIKIKPRSPTTAPLQSVGSKLASSEWPDLGVTITSKSAPGQWLPTTSENTDSTNKADSSSMAAATTIASTSSSSLPPPPPPGFTAKATPTPGSAFPATVVSSSSTTAASARAPGATLNNTVNHSMWTGGVGNVKGNIAGNHLLQSWANFINFSSLSPTQQQQLARGSQIYQQLLIQQQYLIRQTLLIQSNPYYQAQAQALAQAQATLRAQLQQNILRQQQTITAIRAIAGHKITGSVPSMAATSSSGATVANSTSGGGTVPVCLSGATGVQQTHTQHSGKTLTSSEGAAKTSSHGLGEGVLASQVTHQRHVQQQQASQTKQQNRTVSSSKTTTSKNSGGSVPHSSTSTHQAGATDRKTIRLKAK